MQKLLIGFILFLCAYSSGYTQKLLKEKDVSIKIKLHDTVAVGKPVDHYDSLTRVRVKKLTFLVGQLFAIMDVKDSIVRDPYGFVSDLPGYSYYQYDDTIAYMVQDSLFENWEAKEQLDSMMYMELYTTDSALAYITFIVRQKRYFKYTIYDTLSMLEYTQPKWEDIRGFPLREITKARISPLQLSPKYRYYIDQPLSFEEIRKYLKDSVQRFGIDTLIKRRFNIYDYLSDIALGNYLIPYYREHVKDALIRDLMVGEMRKMITQKILTIKDLTGIDIRLDRNYNNLIIPITIGDSISAYKDTSWVLPLWSTKAVRLNPNGYRYVSFNYLQFSSLVALANNLGYDIEKGIMIAEKEPRHYFDMGKWAKFDQ